MNYTKNTFQEVDLLIEKSYQAYQSYRQYSFKQRANFMRQIAVEMEALGDSLLDVAHLETHLPIARLKNERARTIFQLNSYADAIEKGQALHIRIDYADKERTPPKPDIRKTSIGLGPVLVFGASNFPFAYSTAGGDTASAFAAGCAVIVKAHPAHLKTSNLVAEAIDKALKKLQMPENLFIHITDTSQEMGAYLVQHPLIKAAGFTGSFVGGKILYDLVQKRKEPIPFFAEMGSINPVFLLPDKLASESTELASQLAGSITLGMGQFCTNPGIIVGLAGNELEAFKKQLITEIDSFQVSPMLHEGIKSQFDKNKNELLAQTQVRQLTVAEHAGIAEVPAAQFLINPRLAHEVFGPFSLIISCDNQTQFKEVVKSFQGQLTCTLMASVQDMRDYADIISILTEKCGRLNFNTVPTGVEVVWSMQHGGPFPATTDARFGAVGPDAIQRFLRPLAFQNFPDEFLPDELKTDNPLGFVRMVNGDFIK